jgi:MYXO-CTERM domain-containing protein
MRASILVLAILSLSAPSTTFALQTTGDCAAIANPPAGDFSCTGDVTVTSEWLNLVDRAYTIHGNLTLDKGYVLLTSNLTVQGNLTASNSAQIKIAGNVVLDVQSAGNAGGRIALTSGASFQIAGLSAVTVRAESMTMDKGTSSQTYVEDSLRRKVGCGLGVGEDGYYGGGAAHGGSGSSGPDGVGSDKLYGSIESPQEPGSCGGTSSNGSGGRDLNSGGIGGPAIRLQVAGELKVNGSLGADGGLGSCKAVCSPCPCDYFAGAGSGGSLWIEAGSLSGNGSIHAAGGAGGYASFTRYSGSGGGGRVAIYASAGFAGTIAAPGGAASNAGAAGNDGTVFFYSPRSSALDGGVGGGVDGGVHGGVDAGIDGGLDLGSAGSIDVGSNRAPDALTASDAQDVPAKTDGPVGEAGASDLGQQPDVVVIVDVSPADAAPGQKIDGALVADVASAWPNDAAQPKRDAADLPSAADGGVPGARDAATISPAASKSSGCGCRLAAPSNGSSSLVALAALALGLVIGRRRRR